MFDYVVIPVLICLAVALGILLAWRGLAPVSWHVWRLKSKNTHVRESAAKALGDFGDHSAVPCLIRFLYDDGASWSLRREAARSLGRIRDVSASFDLALAVCTDREPFVCRAAAEAFGEIPAASTVPLLVGAYKDEDEFVRRNVVHALGAIGGASAIAALIDALRDQDSLVRRSAALGLGKVGDISAVCPLVSMLSSRGDYSAYECAQGALVSISKRAQDVSLLGSLMEVQDLNVARAAGSVLAQLGHRGVSLLATKARSQDSTTRRAAVEALATVENALELECLVIAMKDDDPDVRKTAADALGAKGWRPSCDDEKIIYLVAICDVDGLSNIGAPVLPYLLEVSASGSMRFRDFAARVLEAVGWSPSDDEENALYYISKQKWENVGALGKHAVRPLVRALRTGEWYLMREASEALARVGDRMICDSLIQSVERECGNGWSGIQKQVQALETLGSFRNDRLIDPVVRALATFDPDYVEEIFRMLGKVVEPELLNPLERVVLRTGEKIAPLRQDQLELLIGCLRERRSFLVDHTPPEISVVTMYEPSYDEVHEHVSTNTPLRVELIPMNDRLESLLGGQTDVGQLRDMGLSSMQQGNYDEARLLFTAALNLDPQHGACYGDRGKAFHETRRYTRAIRDYDYALRLDPGLSPIVRRDRAASHDMQGNYDMALIDYEHVLNAVESEDSGFWSYYTRGLKDSLTGKYDRALSEINTALRTRPSSDLGYHKRGLVYAAKGDDERAIRDYQEALRIAPGSVRVQKDMSRAERRLELRS